MRVTYGHEKSWKFLYTVGNKKCTNSVSESIVIHKIFHFSFNKSSSMFCFFSQLNRECSAHQSTPDSSTEQSQLSGIRFHFAGILETTTCLCSQGGPKIP